MFPAKQIAERRGVAAVEFALVAIPFVLFVFGTLEFGRVIMMKHLLTNAAREGARLASLNTDVNGDDGNMTTSEIKAEITAALAGQLLRDLDIDIRHLEGGPTSWATDASFQHRIAVEIEGQCEPMTPLLYLMSGGTISSI